MHWQMALRKAPGSYRKKTNRQTRQKKKKIPSLGLRQRQRILPKCFEHCESENVANYSWDCRPFLMSKGLVYHRPLLWKLKYCQVASIFLWSYNTVEAHLLRNFIIIILVQWLCLHQIMMMMMMINGISQKKT